MLDQSTLIDKYYTTCIIKITIKRKNEMKHFSKFPLKRLWGYAYPTLRNTHFSGETRAKLRNGLDVF